MSRSLWLLTAVVATTGAFLAVPGATQSSGATICTAAEQAAAAGKLASFKKSMAARRQAFYRRHRAAAARRRFVKQQQAELKTLEQSAACTVIPDGGKVVGSFAVPNDGAVAFGLGSVWVIDRENGSVTNGIPDGKLYRLDPQTGQVQDVIPNVLGSDATLADGAVWVASFALNRLLRIDPTTHTVTTIKTGPSEDEAPTSVVATQGAIWVANHHSGTLVRIDPATNAIAATIPLTNAGAGGLQPLATDGTSVWTGSASDNTLWRINAATNQVIASTTITPETSNAFGICGGIAVDTTGVWVSPGCNTDLITRVDPNTNQVVATVHTDRNADTLDIGDGSVWVVNDTPAWLFRIDPQTNQVVGRLALPATPVFGGLRYADGALWLRVNGAVLKIMPQ